MSTRKLIYEHVKLQWEGMVIIPSSFRLFASFDSAEESKEVCHEIEYTK